MGCHEGFTGDQLDGVEASELARRSGRQTTASAARYQAREPRHGEIVDVDVSPTVVLARSPLSA